MGRELLGKGRCGPTSTGAGPKARASWGQGEPAESSVLGDEEIDFRYVLRFRSLPLRWTNACPLFRAPIPASVACLPPHAPTLPALQFPSPSSHFPNPRPGHTHPLSGSTTMALGCVILPSIRVFLVWAAFSSLATLMVFLGPSSVQ